MYLGYNTNGLAHHRLEDAIRLLSEIGYQGVAITIDHGAFDPKTDQLSAKAFRTWNLLQELGMRCVIETGARYLLDYRRKHQPTLISASRDGRRTRIGFLHHAIEVASKLQAEAVSFWSGAPDDGADPETCFERLLESLAPVLEVANARGVTLAFEPEPGMFIDTMARLAELLERLGPTPLGLTLDVGHLHCLGETPIEGYISKYAPLLKNIHLEDMRRGVHEHLMFGEGEMDIRAVVDALANSGYQGGVFVELSRHSHMGPESARKAFRYLNYLADWKS
jgi:L-ribulose-5-phosphate 3-epimerase